MTDKEVKSKALEIIQVMQMWGINYIDGLRIITHMTKISAQMKPKDWVNPLSGTGIKVQQ